MSVSNIFKIISFIVLMFSALRYYDTRKYIYKLPSRTREKYIGLDSLGRRILIWAVIQWIVSIIISSQIISIILSCVMMYMLVILISELNALKEYVYLKKKMK